MASFSNKGKQISTALDLYAYENWLDSGRLEDSSHSRNTYVTKSNELVLEWFDSFTRESDSSDISTYDNYKYPPGIPRIPNRDFLFVQNSNAQCWFYTAIQMLACMDLFKRDILTTRYIIDTYGKNQANGNGNLGAMLLYREFYKYKHFSQFLNDNEQQNVMTRATMLLPLAGQLFCTSNRLEWGIPNDATEALRVMLNEISQTGRHSDYNVKMQRISIDLHLRVADTQRICADASLGFEAVVTRLTLTQILQVSCVRSMNLSVIGGNTYVSSIFDQTTFNTGLGLKTETNHDSSSFAIDRMFKWHFNTTTEFPCCKINPARFVYLLYDDYTANAAGFAQCNVSLEHCGFQPGFLRSAFTDEVVNCTANRPKTLEIIFNIRKYIVIEFNVPTQEELFSIGIDPNSLYSITLDERMIIPQQEAVNIPLGKYDNKTRTYTPRVVCIPNTPEKRYNLISFSIRLYGGHYYSYIPSVENPSHWIECNDIQQSGSWTLEEINFELANPDSELRVSSAIYELDGEYNPDNVSIQVTSTGSTPADDVKSRNPPQTTSVASAAVVSSSSFASAMQLDTSSASAAAVPEVAEAAMIIGDDESNDRGETSTHPEVVIALLLSVEEPPANFVLWIGGGTEFQNAFRRKSGDSIYTYDTFRDVILAKLHERQFTPLTYGPEISMTRNETSRSRMITVFTFVFEPSQQVYDTIDVLSRYLDRIFAFFGTGDPTNTSTWHNNVGCYTSIDWISASRPRINTERHVLDQQFKNDMNTRPPFVTVAVEFGGPYAFVHMGVVACKLMSVRMVPAEIQYNRTNEGTIIVVWFKHMLYTKTPPIYACFSPTPHYNINVYNNSPPGSIHPRRPISDPQLLYSSENHSNALIPSTTWKPVLKDCITLISSISSQNSDYTRTEVWMTLTPSIILQLLAELNSDHFPGIMTFDTFITILQTNIEDLSRELTAVTYTSTNPLQLRTLDNAINSIRPAVELRDESKRIALPSYNEVYQY
jgi:hypothetical protein